ncbi:MAG TPA: hypothetical protein VMD05_11205 [Candidatus Nanoarchaeia archaeon]|nr:hypothetical protein [Candidatus Nanoarchaeia archaeon]
MTNQTRNPKTYQDSDGSFMIAFSCKQNSIGVRNIARREWIF